MSKKKTEIKNKGGRPRFDFKEEYCDQLITHMATGLSFESFAGALGICKDTLYTLVNRYPEFSDAKKRGFELNRLFWEKIGIQNLINENFGNNQGSKSLNSTVYIFNLKNRFPDEWRDRQVIESKNINTNNNFNYESLSDEELDQKMKELDAKRNS